MYAAQSLDDAPHPALAAWRAGRLALSLSGERDGPTRGRATAQRRLGGWAFVRGQDDGKRACGLLHAS